MNSIDAENKWGSPNEFREPLLYFMDSRLARVGTRLIGPAAGIIIATLAQRPDLINASAAAGAIGEEVILWIVSFMKQVSPYFGATTE